jgi:hypothetical protein
MARMLESRRDGNNSRVWSVNWRGTPRQAPTPKHKFRLYDNLEEAFGSFLAKNNNRGKCRRICFAAANKCSANRRPEGEKEGAQGQGLALPTGAPGRRCSEPKTTKQRGEKRERQKQTILFTETCPPNTGVFGS